MTFLQVAQTLIFIVLLLNTVHLLPVLGRTLAGPANTLQPGFHYSILGIRLLRNGIGLILVPASAAPNPEIHALVPFGIFVFLMLAGINSLLTQLQKRSLMAWSEDRYGTE